MQFCFLVNLTPCRPSATILMVIYNSYNRARRSIEPTGGDKFIPLAATLRKIAEFEQSQHAHCAEERSHGSEV